MDDHQHQRMRRKHKHLLREWRGVRRARVWQTVQTFATVAAIVGCVAAVIWWATR